MGDNRVFDLITFLAIFFSDTDINTWYFLNTYILIILLTEEGVLRIRGTYKSLLGTDRTTKVESTSRTED